MANKNRKRTFLAPPPRPGRIAGKELLFLGAITLLGLGLRLYTLDQESLWLDEGVSVYIMKHMPLMGVVAGDYRSITPGHPPLYHILLRVWGLLAGASPVSARLFSVIAGIAALPLLYLFGRMLFDKKTALIALLLLSISFFHVYYSQEARMYTLLHLLAMASLLLVFKLISKPSNGLLAFFTMVNALGLYTNYFYVYILITHALVVCVLFLSRKRPWKLCLSLALSALLFTPYGVSVMAGEWSPGRSSAIAFTIENLRDILKFFLGIPSSGLNTFASASLPGAQVFFIGALVLLCAGTVRSLKEEKSSLLVLYFVIPLIAYKVVESLVGPMLLYGVEARYYIIILPAFHLILARALTSLPKAVMPLAICFFLFPSLFSLYGDYTTLQKEDWRGAASFLTTLAKPGDAVVVNPGYVFYPLSPYLPHGWPQTMGEAESTDFIFVHSPNTSQMARLPQEFVLVMSQDHARFTDRSGLFIPTLMGLYDMRENGTFAGNGGFNINVGKYYKLPNATNASSPEGEEVLQ